MIRRAQVVLGLAALVGAAFAASSAGQGPPGGSPPGLDNAIAAKQKHAERLLDQPGVAGIGVGLNPAGKPVILIYKEKADVRRPSRRARRCPRRSRRSPGVLRAARPLAAAHVSPTRPDRRLVRTRRRRDRHSRRPRHRRHQDFTHSPTTTCSPVSTRLAVGDPIIHPGDVDGGSDPADRIGTLYAYETIDFDGSLNTMDAAIALTSTADVGTGDAL